MVFIITSPKSSEEMKLKVGEHIDEYEHRLEQYWTPIENILLSGRKRIPQKEIVYEWTKISNDPFWKTHTYPYIEQIFHIYLQEKYKDTKGVSIILGNLWSTIDVLYIKFPVSDFKALGYQNDKILKFSKFEEELYSKIYNKKINLIVIPLVSRTDNGDKGHAIVVMINKYLKTIEYYDSNGSRSYSQNYRTYKYIIDGYFKLRDYFMNMDWYKNEGFTFLDVGYTNPPRGIQSFGDKRENIDRTLPKKLFKVGWCMMYCSIIIHYRIYYYRVDPSILQNRLLNELKRYEENELYASDNVIEFLLNYLVYISEKINDSAFLQKLEKYYPEFNPSKLMSFFIKRHTKPYSMRKF